MKPCSPPQKEAANDKGSLVDVTLLHTVAVFTPPPVSLVIVGHGEVERGGSVPFLNIQKNN